jgi:hypothetical protein
VIRDTEEKDKSNLLTTHIFITQFYEKFDLRTTMLVRVSTISQNKNSLKLSSYSQLSTYISKKLIQK